MKIQIDSFQWWLSNDRNVWQKGAFWKSDSIEYRKNSSYITLNRGVSELQNFTGTSPIVALSFDWNWGTNTLGELLAFCSDGRIYDKNGISYDLSATDWITNFWTANWAKYVIGINKMFLFTDKNNVGASLGTFANANQMKRPVLEFNWDLIIGDGNAIARYNKNLTFMTYSATIERPVLWGLDGTVTAITKIGSSIYVWCASGANTNLYIWDWYTSRASQKITYNGTPVVNVALLGASHYFWTQKASTAIKNVFVGESYQPTRYITSDIPNGLSSGTDNNQNILGIYWTNTNAIETVSDIVYLPWYWRIFGMWRYFPWQTISLNREFTFNGSECVAMLWGEQTSNVDLSSKFIIAYNRSWTYYVWEVDYKDYNWLYATTWYIESLEYVAPNQVLGEDNVKLIVPFELPTSNTSISVYAKIDRGSYTLLRTINTTEYGTGYNVAEVKWVWKWSVIQFKFKLDTTSSTYSPKLMTWIINESTPVWLITSPTRR